ncbi:MAG: hypothetical protein AVDCRST_MAG88-330, partial [uncultured Thermomicrobiales bacterium]
GDDRGATTTGPTHGDNARIVARECAQCLAPPPARYPARLRRPYPGGPPRGVRVADARRGDRLPGARRPQGAARCRPFLGRAPGRHGGRAGRGGPRRPLARPGRRAHAPRRRPGGGAGAARGLPGRARRGVESRPRRRAQAAYRRDGNGVRGGRGASAQPAGGRGRHRAGARPGADARTDRPPGPQADRRRGVRGLPARRRRPVAAPDRAHRARWDRARRAGRADRRGRPRACLPERPPPRRRRRGREWGWAGTLDRDRAAAHPAGHHWGHPGREGWGRGVRARRRGAARPLRRPGGRGPGKRALDGGGAPAPPGARLDPRCHHRRNTIAPPRRGAAAGRARHRRRGRHALLRRLPPRRRWPVAPARRRCRRSPPGGVGGGRRHLPVCPADRHRRGRLPARSPGGTGSDRLCRRVDRRAHGCQRAVRARRPVDAGGAPDRAGPAARRGAGRRVRRPVRLLTGAIAPDRGDRRVGRAGGGKCPALRPQPGTCDGRGAQPPRPRDPRRAGARSHRGDAASRGGRRRPRDDRRARRGARTGPDGAAPDTGQPGRCAALGRRPARRPAARTYPPPGARGIGGKRRQGGRLRGLLPQPRLRRRRGTLAGAPGSGVLPDRAGVAEQRAQARSRHPGRRAARAPRRRPHARGDRRWPGLRPGHAGNAGRAWRLRPDRPARTGGAARRHHPLRQCAGRGDARPCERPVAERRARAPPGQDERRAGGAKCPAFV